MARQHLTGECVAFDIETTGFAAAGGHEVTAVGFVGFDCGEEAGLEQALILLQSGGRDVDVQEVCEGVRAKLPDDVECIVGIEQDEEQEYIPLYVAEIREIESDTREIFLGRLQPYAEMIEERR